MVASASIRVALGDKEAALLEVPVKVVRGLAVPVLLGLDFLNERNGSIHVGGNMAELIYDGEKRVPLTSKVEYLAIANLAVLLAERELDVRIAQALQNLEGEAKAFAPKLLQLFDKYPQAFKKEEGVLARTKLSPLQLERDLAIPLPHNAWGRSRHLSEEMADRLHQDTLIKLANK